jgi:hypothetical protein
MRALDQPAGEYRCALSPRQRAPRPGRRNQAGDEVHCPSPPRPLGRELCSRRATQAAGSGGSTSAGYAQGVGTDTAVSLLIVAGDDPERLRCEAALLP